MLPVTLFCQQQVTVTPMKSEKIGGLGDSAMVVFVADYNNLAIESNYKDLDRKIHQPIPRKDGKYEYIIYANVKTNSLRKYRITVQGTTTSITDEKRSFQSGNRYVFQISIPRTIVMEKEELTGGFNRLTSNKPAIICFETTSPGLIIETHGRLKQAIKIEKESNPETRTYLYWFTVNINEFNKLKKDKEWKRISTIRVKYANSNEEELDISPLSYNVHWKYKVTEVNVKLSNFDKVAFIESLFVPGLGQLRKNHIGNGVFIMTGEVLFVGGAVSAWAYGRQQLKIMRAEGTSYDTFMKAKKNYNTARIVHYSFWGAAAALYIYNLGIAATMKPKNKSLTFYPTLQPTPWSTTPSLGLTLKF
jgi:hypothetical protein